MLVIELDGGQHGGSDDVQRQGWLETNGYKVLRFWNNQVVENLEGVLTVIIAHLPKPSPAGGRGLGEGASRGKTTLTPALSRQREREKEA